MNHLVFLDTRAGELERILSGVKTMLIKELDPAQTTAHPVCPGEALYFLRDNGESAVRVRATVTRVLFLPNNSNEELSHTLKEMQPRLQLTEDQYNHWSAKHHVLLVEFEPAQKSDVIQVSPSMITRGPDWIAFEDFSLVRVEEGSGEQRTFAPELREGASSV
jgi:hypothetical protein